MPTHLTFYIQTFKFYKHYNAYKSYNPYSLQIYLIILQPYCVCVHVRVCVCVHACMHAFMHACACAHARACVYFALYFSFFFWLYVCICVVCIYTECVALCCTERDRSRAISLTSGMIHVYTYISAYKCDILALASLSLEDR